MKNIVFFNHWHYGDLFSTRGLVTDIQRQLPNMRYGYAHALSPLATRDLVTFNLTPEKNQQILSGIDQRTRFAQSDDTIFINTWVGAYEGMWEGTHPPYTAHHNIFAKMYELLNHHFNLNLQIQPGVWDYIPEIDYSKIDTSRVDQLLTEVSGRIYLISNNQVMSLQSSMGFMEHTIEILARQYPNDTFIATHSFETNLSNIKFTYEIFRMSNDLLEISYLSKFCNTIIGKNSSPSTYTNTRSNLLDPSKHFVCFSHNENDTLYYGLDCTSQSTFSNTTDQIEAAHIINQVIKRNQ